MEEPEAARGPAMGRWKGSGVRGPWVPSTLQPNLPEAPRRDDKPLTVSFHLDEALEGGPVCPPRTGCHQAGCSPQTVAMPKPSIWVSGQISAMVPHRTFRQSQESRTGF